MALFILSNNLSFGGGLITKSCPTLVTPWIVACQIPMSMGFPRQEYWSGLPFPSPGDLWDPGIKPRSPALQVNSLPTELCEKPILPLVTNDCISWGFPSGSVIKNLPVKQETQVPSLDHEHPLEKRLATHSRILTWKISWTEEPVYHWSTVHGVTKSQT